jgi:Flagellar hook-length control protein FliK
MISIVPPPLAITPVGAADIALLALQPGQTVSAVVLAMIDATTIRLGLPAGNTIDIKSNVPLATGTRVELAVQGTAVDPKFIITPRPDNPEQPGKQIATGTTGGQSTIGNQAQPSVANQTPPSIPNQTTNSTAGQTPVATLPPEEEAALKVFIRAATVIVRDAAARQGGLTPLYADIETVLAQPNAAVPVPVLDAMQQVLKLRLDVRSANVDVTDLKSALVQSGLANNLAIANKMAPNSVATEFQTALRSLQQALKTWVQTASTPMPDGELPAQTLFESPTASLPQTSTPARAANLMPPFRNAPTVPQAPAAPTITGKEAPQAMAVHLLEETDAATARLTLLQIASLPDQDTSAAKHSDTGTRITFDIPLVTAQGTAVAQIRIERDGKDQTNEIDGKPVWRASFSIDVEPIGPVHVRIALAGARAMVTLNAERADSASRLSAGLPLLEAGLRKAELEPGELSCHARAPMIGSTTPGMFTDRAT